MTARPPCGRCGGSGRELAAAPEDQAVPCQECRGSTAAPVVDPWPSPILPPPPPSELEVLELGDDELEDDGPRELSSAGELLMDAERDLASIALGEFGELGDRETGGALGRSQLRAQLAIAQFLHRGVVAIERQATSTSRISASLEKHTALLSDLTTAALDDDRERTSRRRTLLAAHEALRLGLGLNARPDLAEQIAGIFAALPAKLERRPT